MSSRSSLTWIAPAVAAGMLLATCGGESPSSSSGTPAPAAAATATPVPTARPTALPGTTCNLPAVTKQSDYCQQEAFGGDFVLQVDAAIAKLMSQQPDIFDGGVIKDLPRYRVGVLNNLVAAGLCVQWDEDRDGHRELMVKNTNAYSEQYAVSTSNGTVRNGPNAYRSTCYPANFPVNPQPLPQRGDCKLPSSTYYACDRAGTPQFVGVMDQIVSELERTRTDLVRNGSLVGSWDTFHQEIVKGFLAKGYCAIWDGREIAVKNTNELSEQYQAEYSWAELRRGDQAWRSTCRPAAF